MFAGIMQRPLATSLRISSGSSFSRLATYCISSVITPCRAKFICDMFRLPFAFAASASRFSIQPSRNAITPPRKSLSPGGPGSPSIARHSPATRDHEEQIMAPGNGRGNFVYSSSRLVTLCLSWVVFPTGDEFQWGEVGERLMRAHAVVGVLPTEQLTIQPWRLIGVGVYLIELFVVGAVRALHVRVQLRRLRREHEQRELFLLTGQLEFCGELAAAVDL